MITNYNISFQFHLNNMTQWFDAEPQRLAWLRLLISPIVYGHGLFMIDRERVNREATYNCQTMVMERALNLRYYQLEAWHSTAAPTANGHIYIENVNNSLPISFLYYDVENQPAPYHLYYDSENAPQEVYWYFDSEYENNYDFIVWIPVALTFDESELRAFIDIYVLAGKTYNIQTY